MMASYDTPGKFIIVGEHFVVHGVPAIAAPVTGVRTRVTVEASPQNRISVPVEGQGALLAEQVFDAALRQSSTLDGPVSVSVDSTVPVGFGLGSSAAYSVALVGALAEYTGETLTLDEIRMRAHSLEKIIHGQPSGIDDTVISYRSPVQFCRGELKPLHIGGDFHFVLASCDYPGVTKDAVAAVAAQAKATPSAFDSLVAEAKAVTNSSVLALESGDKDRLGRQMNKAHELLSEVRVSTPELDALVLAARTSGALGAKLTGGGYGGFMVALAPSAAHQDISDALRSAGAHHVLHTTINATSTSE
jgi:mevalonate kinase